MAILLFIEDRRRSNQLLGLGHDITPTTVAMLTGHCVGRTTSAVDAAPLRKRSLLTTFIVSARLRLASLAPHFLSA